uniref:Uncharacterized protein n=1 Tax=viral metagenome TaxID=1070528 RepID=A0A6H1ZM57_9ZZZZ
MQISKTVLEAKYYNMKNSDLCKELDITNPTLVSYLIKYNIPLKGKGNRGQRPKVEIVE